MAMMQDRATDKDTEDAILESWKVIAGDKTFVTKQDMGMAGMDPEHIEYLCANMPQAEGQAEGEYDYAAWTKQSYA